MKNREILIVTEGPDDAKAMRKILRAYGRSNGTFYFVS